MRLKSDVIDLLKYFCLEFENQYGKKIQRVRSDNRSEFFNTNCNTFLSLRALYMRVLVLINLNKMV